MSTNDNLIEVCAWNANVVVSCTFDWYRFDWIILRIIDTMLCTNFSWVSSLYILQNYLFVLLIEMCLWENYWKCINILVVSMLIWNISRIITCKYIQKNKYSILHKYGVYVKSCSCYMCGIDSWNQCHSKCDKPKVKYWSYTLKHTTQPIWLT